MYSVHCNSSHVHKECLECVNDPCHVHIIIIIGMNVIDNLNSV
jgi:hypothetical protein